MAGDAPFWDMDTCARDARESIASRGPGRTADALDTSV